MRCRRWLTAVFALLGAGLLWAGSFLCAAYTQTLQTNEEPLWILKDSGGLLAQYDAGGTTRLQTWPVYTALLPETDVERLQDGIPVYSESELRQLVEDLGG